MVVGERFVRKVCQGIGGGAECVIPALLCGQLFQNLPCERFLRILRQFGGIGECALEQ